MRQATHQDADLVLKLYDLRREKVMRASRDLINGKFWPKSYAEVEAILRPESLFNAAFRQTTGYWEMAYSFARKGVIEPGFLIESGAGEGLFMFSKFEPFLAEMRKNYNPIFLSNTEWIATECEEGRKRLAMIKDRIAKMMATNK